MLHRFIPVIDRLPSYLQRRIWEGCQAWETRYLAQKHLARPAWTDPSRIRAIYQEADRRRRAGEDVVVDHIVPLNHPHVCGLDCEENLCIISNSANYLKSNHIWPGSWQEPEALPLEEITHQLKLEL